jgi:pseudoazurin
MGFSTARIVITAACLATGYSPAIAKDINVQMKNQGAEGVMVFEPSFVKASVGDVIHFLPTDPSHNAETMPDLLPVGAAPMKGLMNKEAVLKVTKPGLYGIKCLPHYAMGMVALVQVGAPSPADVAKAKAMKLPPFAAKRMTANLAKVK